MLDIKVSPTKANLVNNVENMFKSIRNAYEIPTVERIYDHQGYYFAVCTNPHVQHRIEFSITRMTASLRITNIDRALWAQILGKTTNEWEASTTMNRRALSRKEISQDTLNKLSRERDREANCLAAKHFKTEKVTVDTGITCSESNQRWGVVVDITSLEDEIINIISDLLQRSNLVPRTTNQRHYNV